MTETFIDDLEKMTDFLTFMVENKPDIGACLFLKSYNYLTAEEVNMTYKAITTESLADLYRQAENAYIDELNGRETGLTVSSEQAKSAIIDYVNKNLSEAEKADFEHRIESMGC